MSRRPCPARRTVAVTVAVAAAGALVGGFALLAHGGTTLPAVLLVSAYLVLIPAALRA